MAKGDYLYRKATREAMKASPDLAKVEELLTKAHKLDNVNATYALATWYLFGVFYKKSYQKAVEFLIKAAEQLHPSAVFDLGLCYERGAGIEKNKVKAFEHYFSAAILGNKEALKSLCRCYLYGIGVEKNKNLASRCLDTYESSKSGSHWENHFRVIK